MNAVVTQRVIAFLMLALTTACTSLSGKHASLREPDPYSTLAYADDNGVHVLATGELQYNP